MARIKEVREIPLADIEIGKAQVRLRDVAKDIDQLADSIQKVGLLEPIVVAETEKPGRFELITGQRRFLAYQELKKATILAAVLDERVDETTAKVLSVTENLVRRDLNQKDLIDVCTSLYYKYGSVRAVAEETGLPQHEISQYVKYPQLIPELRAMVDKGEVKVETALRAQKAASVKGKTDAAEAIQFAKEMAPVSGAQQKKIVEAREEKPDRPVDEIIEEAKTGGKVTQILVTLTSNVHRSLRRYSDQEGTSIDDAARMLIESGLSEKGFMEEE
ncbi:MAG: ParB/RepB/Spo0J family partition protein [Planctomycetota bacterium]